jgi:hypothetical protein
MKRASSLFDSPSLTWRGLRQKLGARRELPHCIHSAGFWRRLRHKPAEILLHGSWRCLDGCLERALAGLLHNLDPASRLAAQRTSAPRRIPLGLLLLSRQQLTIEQLRSALEAQRAAGSGRIGEWLQQLGFASEEQITGALARQWCCPVLRSDAFPEAPDLPLQIPATLLESFAMVPVAYVASTSALLMAFAERVDYGVLNCLESMLGCRTEACLAAPSLLRERLRVWSGKRGEREIRFDRIADLAELTRIVRSYSILVAASEIRLASCGSHVWIRLLRRSHPPLDLLLGSPYPPVARAPLQASPQLPVFPV